MSSTKRRLWTAAEEALLRARYADEHTAALAAELGRPPHSVLAKANSMGLYKSREAIAQIARERTGEHHASVAYRWQPGHKPWNAGKPGTTGHHPATRAHQFGPGHRPHTWQPVGTYRVVTQKNGGPELQRKVSDEPGPSCVRWHPVARLVWEAAHGPVPAGMIVVFKPGQRTTDPDLLTLDRLECITRVELMRRNTVHRLPKELARAVQLRGVLQRAINTLTARAAATDPQPEDNP